jgi:HEAT repeat protein
MAARALALADRTEPADGIARILGEAEDPFDVAAAVETLGLLGLPEHLPVVSGALSHEDAYVRQCAVAAIELMGHEDGPASVLPLRADKSVCVRMQVAKFMLARERGERHGC